MNGKTIGEKITFLRNEMNITQKELAQKLGISVASIAMYELNERIPRDEMKKKISEFFKVPIQDLFFKIYIHLKFTYGVNMEIIKLGEERMCK